MIPPCGVPRAKEICCMTSIGHTVFESFPSGDAAGGMVFSCALSLAINNNNGNDYDNKIFKKIQKINPQIKIFNSYYKISNPNILNKNSNYLIFSAIGDPSSFKEILLDNKINVIKEIIFPDHYVYKKDDIENICEEAQKINAKIITTEKDFVKLSENVNKKINFLEIELKITEEQSLEKFLYEKLNK